MTQQGAKMSRIVSDRIEQKNRLSEIKKNEEKEAKNKKNSNFVQIEKRALKELRGLIDRNPTAAKVLTIIAEKMNRQNALVCSYDTLSKITNLSRATLSRTIKVLKNEHWIQVVKVGTANAYVVNSRVFWQSYGDKKMTAFNAAIMASSDEQEEPLENWDNVQLKHFPFLNHEDEAIITNEELPPPDQEEIDFHS
jgi:hypothetical protein